MGGRSSEIEKLNDDSLIGKFLICSEYWTHLFVDVCEEKYGYFDTEEEAQVKLDEIGYDWMHLIEVLKIGYPYRYIKK